MPDVLLKRICAWGPRRISADANIVRIDDSREEVDDTTLEDASKRSLAGLFMLDMTVEGGTSVALEQRFLTELEKTNPDAMPLTVLIKNLAEATAGSVAVTTLAQPSSFQWTGDHGQRRGFVIKPLQDAVLYYGNVLYNSVGGNGLTTAAAGTAVQLGALPATKKLVVAYHVLEPPGVTGTSPTLDGRIESAAASGFASPVTRLTFPQRTGPGWHWAELDGASGAITDTWWRVNWTTVGGTTPVFYPLVVAAIQLK